MGARRQTVAAALAAIVFLTGPTSLPPSTVTAESLRPVGAVSLPAPIRPVVGSIRSVAFPAGIPVEVVDRAVYFIPEVADHTWDRSRLFVVDAATGVRHRVGLTLNAGETISAVASDGRHLVVLASRTVNPHGWTGDVPCGGDEDHPVVWRLLAATLAGGIVSGAFRVLDAGRSSLVFTPPFAGQYCAGPIAPLIDVAAGRVAYSIERPSAGQPAGSRIAVRSLATGAVERTVTRPRQVYALALSDSAIAWAESDNMTGQRARNRGWVVRRASMGGGASAEVNVGSRVGWSPLGVDLVGPDVILARWDRDVDVVERIRPGGTPVRITVPGMRRCWPLGGSGVILALECQTAAEASQGANGTILLWRAAGGAHSVAGLGDASQGGAFSLVVRLGPSSIAWHPDAAGGVPSLSVVRLADLRWP
jgi:hypothetical protein